MDFPAAQPPHASFRSSGSDTGAPLTVDPAELHELLHRAATRCSVAWPREQEETTPTPSIFDGFGGARPKSSARRFVPLLPDITTFTTERWKQPVGAKGPSATHIDCAGAKETGFDTIPPIEGAIAAHLLSTGSSGMFSRKGFTNKRDKEFSKINQRAYGMMGAAVRAANAKVLLEGSAVRLLQDAGDSPTPEQMAELRRIQTEQLSLSRTSVQATGRAMAYLVALERARWLDYSKIADEERSEILNRPVSQSGLFGDAMTSMTMRYKSRKEEDEAMKACFPKNTPPVPAPRRFPPPSTRGGHQPQVQRGRGQSRPGPSGPGRGAFQGQRRRFQSPEPAPRGGAVSATAAYRGEYKKKRGT